MMKSPECSLTFAHDQKYFFVKGLSLDKKIFLIMRKGQGTFCQGCILVTRALDQSKALGNSMQEIMRRRVLKAKNWLFEPYGACSLLVLT